MSTDDRYRPIKQTVVAPKTRLVVELKVHEERENEDAIDTIAKGIFLSWFDLRWWLSTHAVDDLDVDD